MSFNPIEGTKTNRFQSSLWKKSAFIVFRRAFEINVTLLCVMAASFTFWWAHDYAQQSPQSLLITSHPHGQGRASEGSFISDNVRYPLCGHHRPVPFLPRTICFTGGGEGAVKEITWGKSEPMSTELGYKPDGWRQRNFFFFSLLCHVPKPHVAMKPQSNSVHAIFSTPLSQPPSKRDWRVFVGTTAVSFESSWKIERRVCFRIRGWPLFTRVWERRLFAPEASRKKTFLLNFLKGTRSKSLYFFGEYGENYEEEGG